MNPQQVALQLYTVRAETARDFLGTLGRVAEIGYRAVELAGFGGLPVAELRAALDRLGLRAMGAHVPLADFEARLPTVLAELSELGCGYAVVPWLPEERRDPARAHELAATLNRLGAACRDAGLGFAYHNHAFEFEPPAGDGNRRTLFELLATETDPALVAFELDAYWAAYAGHDPVELLRRHAGRVPLLHLKDMTPAPDKADAPVGEGTLPWPQILAAASEAGVEWGIVEQDHPRDPLGDSGRALRNLERLVSRQSPVASRQTPGSRGRSREES